MLQVVALQGAASEVEKGHDRAPDAKGAGAVSAVRVLSIAIGVVRHQVWSSPGLALSAARAVGRCGALFVKQGVPVRLGLFT